MTNLRVEVNRVCALHVTAFEFVGKARVEHEHLIVAMRVAARENVGERWRRNAEQSVVHFVRQHVLVQGVRRLGALELAKAAAAVAKRKRVARHDARLWPTLGGRLNGERRRRRLRRRRLRRLRRRLVRREERLLGGRNQLRLRRARRWYWRW